MLTTLHKEAHEGPHDDAQEDPGVIRVLKQPVRELLHSGTSLVVDLDNAPQLRPHSTTEVFVGQWYSFAVHPHNGFRFIRDYQFLWLVALPFLEQVPLLIALVGDAAGHQFPGFVPAFSGHDRHPITCVRPPEFHTSTPPP